MPITSKNFQSNYGFPNPLDSGAPAPIVANRDPKTNDFADVGTVWVYPATKQSWILVSTGSGNARWNLMEAGGTSGVFSTLTSVDTTALATGTDGSSSANTFGNTNGATSVSIVVGTGGFRVDGVASSSYSIGGSTTTGAITIGGNTQTGSINIGTSSSSQTINIAAGSGAQTVNIGTAGTGVVGIGNATGGVDLSGLVTLTGTLQVEGGAWIFSGTGNPTVAAPQGSLYLRTDATTTTSRLWINTNGSTGWTFFTSNA